MFPFGNTLSCIIVYFLALCFLFFRHSFVKVVSQARRKQEARFTVFKEQISLKCMFENESR